MKGNDAIVHLFGPHPATSVTAPAHKQVNDGFIAFCNWLDHELPDTEAKDMAFTKLKEAAMWSNFSIAEGAPVANAPQQRESLFDNPNQR